MKQTAATVAALILLTAAGARADTEPCRNTANFDAWLKDFRKAAAAEGITPKTIAATLDGVRLDPKIISRDRRQSFFWQDFLKFSDQLATRNRVVSGIAQIQKRRAIFDRAEKEHGVPAPVIAAFWALESDFGLVTGKTPILPSLATLAYDCRRGEMFRTELIAALRIVDRGDLRPAEMIGSWAGELGQMQFLPSHYYRHAVDYDGDGRRDLLKSSADAIGSTAAFIESLGWRRGEPWIEEVRVPKHMAWEEADPAIVHPRSFWIAAGVTLADGKALDGGEMPASLLLPMGRNGPAFLAGPNFHAYLEWNESLNYAMTAAYLATRIAGAPPMRRGDGTVEPVGFEQVREVQLQLQRRGFAIDKVDGKLGANTRAAVRAAQIRFKLPADAYPTTELLRKLGTTPTTGS